MHDPEAAPKTNLMTKEEICTLLACSKKTVERLVETNRFPSPIKFSKRMYRWRRADVEKHLASPT